MTRFDRRRLAPVALAAALAAVYLISEPPSLDLAAHLFRAQLFSQEGFAIWNNDWYSGHHVVGYSVLFPALSSLLSPQLAAALAATGTAAAFEPLAQRHFGPNGWLGALVFAAATATNLFTGRLAFAFGALPATAAILALDSERSWLAALLGGVTALCSPVAALFAALAGLAHAIGKRADPNARRSGVGLAVASLAPVAALAVAFPEGGYEPFVFSALWPIPVLAAGALAALPREATRLRAGIVLYTVATVAAYLVHSPVGSNAARFGTFIAAPLAALLLWPARIKWLALLALPTLYLEWHAPVRDLTTAVGDPSASAGYYQPLLGFLGRQPGPPFRVEIPFTQFHWEAYVVARRFPTPRGWERQLDIRDNALFYDGRLTPAAYSRWLHAAGVRFVAAPDAPLDYAGRAEAALIRRGLPYLKLVFRATHWRVYAVRSATPIVTGAATLEALGPESLTLNASTAGVAFVRVHFTPYWTLSLGSGCVMPWGEDTAVRLRRPGKAELTISFSLGRIAASSARCTPR